jgi:hypothetical protein
MKMKNLEIIKKIFIITFILLILNSNSLLAQINVEGDFRIRWYSDSFFSTQDNRTHENYMRYLGRIRAKARVAQNTTFQTELITLVDNPASPVRNIVGTGPMRYGISQIFAEMTQPNFLVFDVARFRIGRQQFPIGNGLSMGESYYFLDKFDGARVDLAYKIFTLSMFGAITGQNLSSTGLYPEPGSDQIYVARLGVDIKTQDVMAYMILHKPRGLYNDSYILGIGPSGSIIKDLEYFGEFAYQKFNTVPGLPEKGGIGYLAGVSYRWSLGPFRSIKVETRYAAYQGDNAKTNKIEQFSPPYPSFFWGDRTGYVNSEIGGDFPNKGKNLEGSRIWYSRIYFIPKVLPSVRIQFQYTNVKEYVDNDSYNSMDDEISSRIYYTLSKTSQMQLRYDYVMPNGTDNGTSSTNDRYYIKSLMLEWQINF